MTYTASYPDAGAGAVEWPDGRGTDTAVDGLAQRRFRTTTAGTVDVATNLSDINHIITNAAPDPAAEALVETTLATLPRYQPLAHHAYAVRDVDPDGNVTLDLGPVRTFKPARPSRLRTEWKSGPDRVKVLGTQPAPTPDLEPSSVPRPLPFSESVVAPECTAPTVFRHVAFNAPAPKTPYSVTLTDVTPIPGKTEVRGLVGEKGIEGHRIGKTVKLKLDVKDRDGNPPPHPVLLRLAVGGPHSGRLIVGAPGAQHWCKEAFVVWHQADSQGIPGTDPLAFDYVLGTLSLLPGVEPDPDHPGQVKPVWGPAESLNVTTEVVTSDATVLNLTTFVVRPQPGRPHHLLSYDRKTDDDRYEWWNGFRTYFDPATQARTVGVTLHNSYYLADQYDNIFWGTGATRAQHGGSRLSVQFPDQKTTGPDFRAYALDVKWWADGSDQMPSGLTSVGLYVSYPDSLPDWTAGEVSKAIEIDLQGGNQTHLKSYGGYEARFGIDDGGFPVSVSPGATEPAIPNVTKGPAPAIARSLDSKRRLALVLVTGREAPSVQEVFRAPHHRWEQQGAVWVEKPLVPAPDPHVDVASKPKLKLKLVDVHGNVQTAAGFKVHFCPRFDHEGSPVAPEWSCPTTPRESTDGVIQDLTMNPGVVGNGDPPAPDATGYLGLELTTAPMALGTYYVYVESLDNDVKVRDQSLLYLDESPAGQYQGGFALCTVTGAEILDQNFQRVNPIAIQAPTPAWVRYALPGSTVGTLQRKLRTEDVKHAIVTPNTDIALTKVGQSATYLAPITLLPEGHLPAGRRALNGTAPEVTLSLGQNDAILSTPQGSEDARCGVDFPAVLQFRFVKRDGSGLTDADASHTKPGTKQETEIGGAPNYPEVIQLEIQAVDKDDRTKICCNCSAEVGLQERPNPLYKSPLDRFFNDNVGSTKLSSGGKVDGSFLALSAGVVRTTVRSVGDVRKDVKSPYGPLPPSTATDQAAYAGSKGAHVLVIPHKSNRMVIPDDNPQYLDLWVDERNYGRQRGSAAGESDWSDGGNGTRDWLEKKARDLYADWSGDSEVEIGMAQVSKHTEKIGTRETAATTSPLEFLFGANGPAVTTQVQWNLSEPGFRRPITSDEYHDTHWYVDQAGIGTEVTGKDRFLLAAVHEARHSWQYTLSVTTGGTAGDNDSDYAVANPPASAPALRDARYALDGGPGNSELDLNGDCAFDSDSWSDIGGNSHSPLDFDAIRKSGALLGVAMSCLSDYTLDATPHDTPLGKEIWAAVTFTGRGDGVKAEAFEGVTVIFEDTSGAASLSELVDGFSPSLDGWNPNLCDPNQVVRQGASKVSSRTRYPALGETNKGRAEGRVLVTMPGRSIKVSVRLPNECAGRSLTKPVSVP